MKLPHTALRNRRPLPHHQPRQHHRHQPRLRQQALGQHKHPQGRRQYHRIAQFFGQILP